MFNADLMTVRPILTNETVIARTLDAMRRHAETPADVWRRLTENYVVDLDAVAALLPKAEPEPVWLQARR